MAELKNEKSKQKLLIQQLCQYNQKITKKDIIHSHFEINTKLVYPYYAQREIKRSVNTVTEKVIVKTLIKKTF